MGSTKSWVNPNQSDLLLPLLSCFASAKICRSFAKKGFSTDGEKYRKKQEMKSYWSALFNPFFSYRWINMLQSDDLKEVVSSRPRLYFKPYRVYMSVKWSKKRKVKVITETYRFIRSKELFNKKILAGFEGFDIARFKLGEKSEGILKVCYDERYRKEGELVLNFICHDLGGLIASLSFSFEQLKDGNWVSRIGCIQGNRLDNDDQTKATQKLLHGMRPKAFMVFAIQEFSRHLGLTAVYGAGDSIQAYRGKHAIHLPWLHAITFDYDTLWKESGGHPSNEGWFELPVIPVRKQKEEIKTNKRSLYAKRYALFDEISAHISETVLEISGLPKLENSLNPDES